MNRLLLVEDYPTIRQVLLSHLRSGGFDVDLAVNGRQAVESFKRKHYDLILMDIQMPDMNGYEAARAIRKLENESGADRRVKILALTANAAKEDYARCIAAGMDGCLPKPIRKMTLLEMVRKWTESGDEEFSVLEKIQWDAKREKDAPIDLNKAVGDLFDKENFLREIVGSFLKELGGQMKRLEKAVDQADCQVVSQEAHSIKGAALFLSADRLGSAAQKLEACGDSGEMEKAPLLYQELKWEVRRLKDYVLAQIDRGSRT